MLFSQLTPPQPKFKNFTVEDGHPGSETYYVHQDRKGYIWIATDRGVARYDGLKFQIFTINEGLTDNVVFKIYEDFEGRIWFITFNSKLCYFENEKFHPYKYNHIISKNQKYPYSPMKNFFVDRSGNVYFSEKHNGLFIIDKNGKYTWQGSYGKLFITKFGDNLLWIDSPLKVYEKYSEDSIDVCYINHSSKPFTKFETGGRMLLASNSNDDYLFINQELYSLSSKKEIYNIGPTISMYAKDKSLWIGTFKGGVRYFPDSKNLDKSFLFLDGLSVSSVLMDNEGGFWFSTLEKGIFYTPNLAIKNYGVEQGLIDNEIISITGIRNDIYLGFLLGRWQNVYNPKYKDSGKKGYTRTALGHSDLKFYISLDRVNELKGGKASVVSPGWSPDYYTKGNSVIYGCQSIYRRFDDNRTVCIYNYDKDKTPQKKNSVQTLMLDDRDRVWCGLTEGLYYVDHSTISNQGLNDPLFKIRVSDLACHKKWKNIAATRGEGIYFFDNKKIIRQLTVKDGLLSNSINVIFLDQEDGIWIGTNKGLNYVKQGRRGIEIQSITMLHGLCSNEISSIYVNDHIVYVGTKEGLSVIDTKEFKKNDKKLNIIVTSIATDNQNYDPSVHHIFSYKEGYIKISFRNTNYRSLQHGLYKYRISKSSEWIYTETPEVLLINPLSGEYNLEISYRNEDGNWSDSKVYASFIIDEVFYKKSFFYIGISIVLGIIFWLLYRYRVGQLKQRHKLNNKIRNLEQKALQAQMNPHFIFNALNSIQSFLVYEENDKAEKYLLKFAQLIRQTLSNSREVYISVETEIETLTKYLDLERMRFKDKFSYEIENFIEAHDLSLKIPGMLVQPFVENAVIHGFSTLESGGKIKITLKLVDQYQLLCIVEDNGVGRKKTFLRSSAKHVSFGTTITEERLKAFETKHGIHFHFEIIDIENEDGTTGTKVLINLPIIY